MVCAVLLFTLLSSFASRGNCYVVTSTSQGLLKGKIETVEGKTVEAYQGIPYAHPPVGHLRFRKPVPSESWNGTYDATHPKHSCIQPRFSVIFIVPTDLSEDCLYLNVWTTGPKRPLKPVLVWIHGGAFKFGSSHERWYNGAALAALNDVVVVSFNYRLGMLGFFDSGDETAPGNVGLWDQNLALRWVRQNIENFGGDPDAVTVFGESAGAMSIHAHMLSPHSEGLFTRAFLLSGTLSTNTPVDSLFDSVEKGNDVAKQLGCADAYRDLTRHPREVVDCLRTKDPDAIHRASEEAAGHKATNFLPSFKNEFLPTLPSKATAKKEYRRLDTLISATADEGAFGAIFQPDQRWLVEDLADFDDAGFQTSAQYLANSWCPNRVAHIARSYVETASSGGKQAVRKAVIDFVGDIYFKCPTMVFNEQHSDVGGKSYAFVFGYRSAKYPFPEFFGVPHTSDIPYYFGAPFLDTEAYTDEDRKFSRKAMDMFVSFAKTGKPKHPGGLPWPPFSKENRVFQWIQPGNYTTVEDLSEGRCAEWKKFI